MSPFEKMSPPAVAEKPVPVPSPEEITKLLGACQGAGFFERRDTAIIRMLLDTGVRASEAAGINLDSVDFNTCLACSSANPTCFSASPTYVLAERACDRVYQAATTATSVAPHGATPRTMARST
ncbi:hypothetical protein GCM10023321_43570 [Pseudonocardia eucalypti]|uniref:Tyr recombinase domain-containing protein n=1 Tax=Pseudonocardia eucalypti TaxID=648755 RepID=A0ABP9QEF7_9PSEU